MNKKNDPREIRTRNALISALTVEMKDKDIKNISVSAICRRANVDRTTFYRHYEDKEDFIKRGISQFFSNLVEKAGCSIKLQSDYFHRIDGLFYEIQNNYSVLRHLFLYGWNGLLEKELKTNLIDLIVEERLSTTAFKISDKNSIDMLVEMFVSCLLGIIRSWLTKNNHWDVDQVKEVYTSFIKFGFSSFIMVSEV